MPSSLLRDVVEMRLQRGQQLGREAAHALVVAGLGVALEQLNSLDVRLVLHLDVGLVEVGALLGRELVHDHLVLCVELVGRGHGEVGLQHRLTAAVGQAVEQSENFSAEMAVRFLSGVSTEMAALYAARSSSGDICS